MYRAMVLSSSRCRFRYRPQLPPLGLLVPAPILTLQREKLLNIHPLQLRGAIRSHCRPYLGLDSTTLRGPTAVVRNRRNVANQADPEARRLQSPQSRLSSGTGTVHVHRYGSHPVFDRLLGCILCSKLCSKRCRLTRPFETTNTSRRPGDHIPRNVSDGHNGVIEGRLNMSNATLDVLFDLLLNLALWLRHGYPLRSCRLLTSQTALARTLTSASVGVGTLASHRKSTAVTQSSVAAKIHQTLDVH